MVQLRNAGGKDPRLEGSIDEVDTGKQRYFRSEFELIEFLRESRAGTRASLPGEQETR